MVEFLNPTMACDGATEDLRATNSGRVLNARVLWCLIDAVCQEATGDTISQ
jgi:hypothetical protein